VQAAALTAEDWKRIQTEEVRQAEEDLRRLEEQLEEESAVLRLPAFLAHPLVWAALVGITGLLGLFVFSHVCSTLASLATLPDLLRYAGYAGLALLTLAVLYAVVRLAGFYISLRPNRPIPLEMLQQLAQRSRWRSLVHARTREAREHLVGYLRLYPLGSPAERKVLVRLGLPEERLASLEQTRDELLDPDRYASLETWFGDFRDRFQRLLDEAADRRIIIYARRVAVLTAASPNTLVDTLLTSYCSFMMLADLCQLYNLRATRLGTAVLLTRIFFNAYVAGQLNEFETVTSSGLESLINESGLHLGSTAAEAVTAKVAGKVGARVASGALNYFMLRRLGRYAVRLLHPVAVA
jgi:uncharacterized membrane protein YcjF (UPF0283 family)